MANTVKSQKTKDESQKTTLRQAQGDKAPAQYLIPMHEGEIAGFENLLKQSNLPYAVVVEALGIFQRKIPVPGASRASATGTSKPAPAPVPNRAQRRKAERK